VFEQLKLHEKLLQGVAALGFENLTPVQAQAIPAGLAGRDLLVKAATGSGKTAAFMLPLLQRLLTEKGAPTGTRALILTPTRELANQVASDASKLAAFTDLKVGVITGGQSQLQQRALFRKDPQIIVATPGRMLEHIQKSAAELGSLEVLVLDEADRMLDMGLVEDVTLIINASNQQRQTMLFSATLPLAIRNLAAELLQDAEIITVDKEVDEQPSIRQQYILADDDKHKEKLLLWLLENETYAKTIVFTNTRDRANEITGLLRYRHVSCDLLHGELKQDRRSATITAFRNDRFKVLVASDVAARGLDVKGVDLIINFDMARKGDDYVHRIGRTGRAGETGLAISLIGPFEWNLRASIERYLQIRMERRGIKALAGTYRGPKKVKKSGKAAGSKKKRPSLKKT
jgi:ATP-dependent RNA helicase SrmB